MTWRQNRELVERVMKLRLANDDKYLPYSRKLIQRAKELRKHMTGAECKIWYAFLRKLNPKFLRQRPIDLFIVDFYCPTCKLVIEIDGDSHFSEFGKGRDAERTQILEEYGLRVIRYTNRQIFDEFKEVKEDIQKHVALRLDVKRGKIPPTPSAPPPL